MRRALLALFLFGCSSNPQSTAPPPDLAVPSQCTLVFTGDQSDMRSCYARFCRSAAGDSLQLYGGPVGSFQAELTVAGAFSTGRAYGAADLSAFAVSARFDAPATFYDAGSQIAGSTVALTFDQIQPNDNVGCASGNADAHGTARVAMVERLDADAGASTPGHVTLVASF